MDETLLGYPNPMSIHEGERRGKPDSGRQRQRLEGHSPRPLRARSPGGALPPSLSRDRCLRLTCTGALPHRTLMDTPWRPRPQGSPAMLQAEAQHKTLTCQEPGIPSELCTQAASSGGQISKGRVAVKSHQREQEALQGPALQLQEWLPGTETTPSLSQEVLNTLTMLSNKRGRILNVCRLKGDASAAWETYLRGA